MHETSKNSENLKNQKTSKKTNTSHNFPELVCARCGASSNDKSFIGALCVDCYEFNYKIPPKIEILKCKRCGKIRLSGKWVFPTDENISNFVVSKCKGDFISAKFDPKTSELSMHFEVESQGETKDIEVKRKLNVEFTPVMCTYCSRISGGYFEAIIQLRGNKNRVKQMAQSLISRLSEKTFITKEEERHGGIDLYVGSSKAVLELMHERGYKPLITRKLVGRKNGKRLYRVTFALRL